MTDPTPRRGALLLALILAGVAVALFRPWDPRPFDTVDFSEFLPFLRAEGGAGDHLAAVVRYYVTEHGRLNLASYVALVAKWEVFGEHTALWHWARTVQMLGVGTAVYALFRRLDVARSAAVAGASLFVVSRISGEAWTRLTMGEPLGLCFALAAMLLATGWRADPSLRRGLLIGAAVTGAVLAKEMLIGMMPMVWIVGACRAPDGRLGSFVDRTSAWRLAGWIGVPAALTFGAAALVALGGGPEGLSTLYGSTTPTVGTFLGSWQRPWQIQGLQPLPRSWLLPANTLFGLLSLAGGVVAVRGTAEERRHLCWVAGSALLLSALYAGLYLPWPTLYLYYALPFFLGPALLFAVALTTLERRSAAWGRTAMVGWLLILVAAGSSTARAARGAIAVEQVSGELTRALARYQGADSIVVARRTAPAYRWTGTAPRLQRYILATGLAPAMPPMVDRLCRETIGLRGDPPPGVVVVSYHHWCGPVAAPTERFVRGYPFVAATWGGLEAGADTFGVDLLAGRAR